MWDILHFEAILSLLSNSIGPYMWSNGMQARFMVLSKRAEGFSSFPQKATLKNVGSPVQGVQGVDEHTIIQPAVMGSALGYLTYLLFNMLHFRTLIFDPSIGGERCEELNKYIQQGTNLHVLFCNLWGSFKSLLKFERPLGRSNFNNNLKPRSPSYLR